MPNSETIWRGSATSDAVKEGPSTQKGPIGALHAVVLNWNLPHDTIACVESIHAAPMQASVVVVDNGSTDNSVAFLREHLEASVHLLASSDNLGFAGGMNLGIQWALARGAGWVLLLNNDTILAPDMIPILSEAAQQSPRGGIFSPVIYYSDRPQRIWRFGDRESRWLPTPLRIPDAAVAQAGGRPFPVDYVTACAMLVRREVFEAIGFLDPHYFMYFEDADFCRRAREAGFEVWVVPRAKIWHKVASSARQARPFTRYTQEWGRARFYKTHPHGPWRGLTMPYLLARSARTTVQDVLAGDWALIRPLWRGFLDGQRGRPCRMPDSQACSGRAD